MVLPEAVPWSKPEDLPYAPDRPLTGLFAQAEDVRVLAVFMDATVRFVSRRPGISFDAQMRAAITRNGREPKYFDPQPRPPRVRRRSRPD